MPTRVVLAAFLTVLGAPLAAATSATLVGGQGNPRPLAREPGPGQLHLGEVVFVDDGTCPPGQIKRVIGGSNRDYGADRRRTGTARQVACVPRAR